MQGSFGRIWVLVAGMILLGMSPARADILGFHDQQIGRSSTAPPSAPPGLPTYDLMTTTTQTGIFSGLPIQDFGVVRIPAPPPDEIDHGEPRAPLTQFQIADAAFGSFTATTTGDFNFAAGMWTNPSPGIWKTGAVSGEFIPGSFFAPCTSARNTQHSPRRWN